jgi:hypothetical protein
VIVTVYFGKEFENNLCGNGLRTPGVNVGGVYWECSELFTIEKLAKGIARILKGKDVGNRNSGCER